jgi:hypothetical protein
MQSWLPRGFNQTSVWRGRRLPPNPQPPPRYDAADLKFENLTISGIDHDACVVSWALSEKATLTVRYGVYPALDKALPTQWCRAHHGYSENVIGLAASTTYVIVLEAVETGYTTAYARQIFTTLARP